MNPIKRYLFKAAAAAAFLLIVDSIIWELMLPGKIYFCSDNAGFGFLRPGNWVHGEVIITEIMPTEARMGPDYLIRGWTNGYLWLVWGGMTGTSMALAFIAARFRWLPSECETR